MQGPITLMDNQTGLPDNFKLQQLVDDACRFAQAFIRVMEEHPLQVYGSAVPCTPTNTTLYRHFHHISQNPWIAMGADTSWSPLLLTFRDIETCQCLAFSPDSMRVVFGTMHGTFHIHDTTTGAAVLAPTRNQRFDIPQGLHRRCAFSPDGSWVVSVLNEDSHLLYDDDQLCTQLLHPWDSSSGAQIREPILVGHFRSVRDLIVSPDGELIACSSDATIHVWV
jgi:WD40 repeat protein